MVCVVCGVTKGCGDVECENVKNDESARPGFPDETRSLHPFHSLKYRSCDLKFRFSYFFFVLSQRKMHCRAGIVKCIAVRGIQKCIFLLAPSKNFFQNFAGHMVGTGEFFFPRTSLCKRKRGFNNKKKEHLCHTIQRCHFQLSKKKRPDISERTRMGSLR